jgi:hypothetical protein
MADRVQVRIAPTAKGLASWLAIMLPVDYVAKALLAASRHEWGDVAFWCSITVLLAVNIQLVQWVNERDRLDRCAAAAAKYGALMRE